MICTVHKTLYICPEAPYLYHTSTVQAPYIHPTSTVLISAVWGICNIFKKCSLFFENDVVRTKVLENLSLHKGGSPVLKTLLYALFFLKIQVLFFAVCTSYTCMILHYCVIVPYLLCGTGGKAHDNKTTH